MISSPANWSRAQRGIAIVVAAVVVAATVIAFAVRSPGYAQTDVDLSTSTVWTTNNTESVVGRVNMQIKQLNSALKSNPDFDVLQGDDQVFAVDRTKNQIKTIDTSTVTTGAQINLPKSAGVAYGGGVLSIVAPATGKWWAGTPQVLSGLDPATAPPLLTLPANAVTGVSQSGTAFAVAPGSDKLWSLSFGADGLPTGWPRDSKGKVVAPTPATLSGGALSAVAPSAALTVGRSGISLTVVGDTPVILDATAGALVIHDRRIPLADAAGAVLQQPGPAADSVLVATTSQLLQYPLTGGAPKVLSTSGDGAAVAPVLLDGCAWAAWNGPSTVEALACDGGDAQSVTLPGVGKRDPVFRVNGHAIVLNDRISGTIWSLDRNMTVTTIDNWEQVKPEDQSNSDDNTDGAKTQSTEIAASRADCAKQGPAKSTAKNAKYQVRAGRSTVLPILDYVTAGDCAAVAVGSVSKLPGADGSVDVVNAGQAVQVTVPQGASGPLPALVYTVNDGINPAVQATLSVTVAPAGQPGDVKKQRESSTEVEINGSVGYNVLPDYYSTTGDDLYLTGATATTAAEGDTVDFTPAGQITFHDKGSSGTGNHEVLFSITDGNVVRAGKLTVNVKADGDTQPIASAVVSQTLVNVPITVKPLDSVLSPSVEPLRLVNVAPKGGASKATAAVHTDDGTVTLQSGVAGTYYFTYNVVAGDGKSTGVLRFDVGNPPAKPAPPIATADVVYLPEGDSVRVDPTANDLDPNGSGLAVAQVVGNGAGALTVTDTAMQTLQIAPKGSLAGPVVLPYVVSNGAGSANGQIRVVPVPPLDDPPSPVANPISLTVRAGDAITLPVSRFASDPRGEVLTPTVVQSSDGAAVPGVLFATSTGIRYLAPTTAPAGPVRFSYSVTNTTGQTSAAASVTLTVADRNPAVNSAPNTPATVVGRVFTGQSVTVALPLDGIDPDGDWVTVTGINGSAKGLGTAAVGGLSSITYNALAKPGVDTVTYTVSDPYGKKTTGSVTMIVVSTPNVVQPPVAPNLVASMRPGKAVAVHPLQSGVTGENVKLADPAIDQVAGWQAVADGDALVISAPGKTSDSEPFNYHVIDDRGLTGSGVISVTISPTAPLVPPVAQDVVVTGAMVTDKVNALVDVSGSIQNNTGRNSDLLVGLTARESATLAARTVIRIPLTVNRQVLAYTATDGESQAAKAFIVVPPKADLVTTPQPPQQQQKPDQPPAPKPSGPTITVDAGATATGRIADYVDVAAGKTAQIPAGSSMSATQGTGQRVNAGTFSFTASKTGSGRDVLGVTASDGGTATVRVSVPINIIPATPVLNSTSLNVEVGTSGTVNLVSLISPANYPNMSSLTFNASSPGNGFDATRSGTGLTVAVANSVSKGATAQVPISVTDSKGVTVSASVTVTATGTTKPLPTVGDQEEVGRPGVGAQFDVLSGSSDPYGAGLTVLPGPKILQGKGTASLSGSRVVVTPAAGQIGDLVVQYTVGDGTRDPSRDVSGKLTLTVKDKPHVPGQPTPVPNSATASSVTLTWDWQQSWANGGTMEPFVVSAAGVPDTNCPSNSCQIGNLTPGRSYAFTVTATNEDGSARSRPSASVTPDAKPPVPATPAVTLSSDKQLTVTWKIEKDDSSYSPVSSATLTQVVNGSDSGETRINPSGSGTKTFSQLDIDSTYSYYVTVTNKKGTVQSASSTAQHPNTTPGPATAVSLAFAPDSHTVTASWTAPAASAQRPDPDGYTVTYTVDGAAKTVTAAGDAASVTIPDPVDGRTYSVTKILAHNKFGNGDASGPSSDSVKPFSRPGAVTAVSATATGADNTVKLDGVAGGQASGRDGSDFYSTDQGSSWKGFNSGDSVTTDSAGGQLANGTKYTFAVRVCYPDEDPYTSAQLCGAPGNSPEVVPYGPVGSVTNIGQSGGDSKSITFTWTPAPDNGRPAMTTKYNIDGAGYVDAGQAKSVTKSGWSCGDTHRITLQGFDSEGHAGPESAAFSGSTTACPAPGAPTKPQAIDHNQTQIRFTWNAPADNGKGPLRTQYDIGNGWQDAGAGSANVVVGDWKCGTSHDITVRAIDTTGLTGATNSGSGSTADCPPAQPSIQAYVYGDANGHDAGTPGSTRCVTQGNNVCKFIGVHLLNYPAGQSVGCRFESNSTKTVTTDGSASQDVTNGWYSGFRSATITCNGTPYTVTW